jgi:Cu(I)/Ag(I) efflux system membrane fusion protein
MKIKKIFFLGSAFFLIGVSAVYFKRINSGEAAAEKRPPQKTLYQCPMHPQIIRDRPGQCPICGMDLRPMDKIKEKTDGVLGRAPVALSPQRLQLIGVTYGKAKIRSLTRRIQAPGRIAYDPQLYEALEEYRQALKALNSAQGSPQGSDLSWARSMKKATILKLKLLGLSPAQVSAWAKDPSLDQGLLLGKRGQAVWVYADIYEYDLPFVRPGMSLQVKSETLPGKSWMTKVLSIDPVINPKTRTARLRARLDDVLGLLKPGTYVDVAIDSPLGNHLSVPESAVLDTGDRQYVFIVKEDGTLKPQAVELGNKAEGYDEILSGLNPGETVSTSANFLIDAESQFQSAIESFAKPGQDSKNAAPSDSMGSMPGMKM